MRQKDHLILRLYDGARIYYGPSGWTSNKTRARKYYEQDAIRIAEQMSEEFGREVYVKEFKHA